MRRPLLWLALLTLLLGAPVEAKEREQLKLVSLNVWGLWGISKRRAARIERLGPAILALDPDVVCLQEVWVEEDGETLSKAFAAAGLKHSTHASAGFLGSGLFVASRYPIKGERFEAFDMTGKLHKVWHGDAWTRKGGLEVRLETPLGALRVAVTHLHARYGTDEYLPVQLGQAAQLGHFLGDLGINPPPRGADPARDALILVGDLNARRDTAPFELLNGIAALEPPPRAALDQEPRIDWVLTRQGGGLQVRVRRVRHVLTESVELGEGALGPLSDHPGLAIELELRRGAPQTFRPRQDRLAYAAARARALPILAQAQRACDDERTRWRNRALVLMVIGGAFTLLVHSKRGPKGSKGKCAFGCLGFIFLHVAIWAMYLAVIDLGVRSAGCQRAINRLPELPPDPPGTR